MVRIISDHRWLLFVALLRAAETCKTEHQRAGIAHRKECS